jgi:hypothetical protein
MSIFLAKFVAVDANGLNILFSGNDITFLNPHCKKENPPKYAKDTSSFSQLELSAIHMIALTGHCTSQFQLEPFFWETNFPELLAVLNEYFSSRLSYQYFDKDFPPPRLT